MIKVLFLTWTSHKDMSYNRTLYSIILQPPTRLTASTYKKKNVKCCSSEYIVVVFLKSMTLIDMHTHSLKLSHLEDSYEFHITSSHGHLSCLDHLVLLEMLHLFMSPCFLAVYESTAPGFKVFSTVWGSIGSRITNELSARCRIASPIFFLSKAGLMKATN